MPFTFFKKKPPHWLDGYPYYEQPFAAAAGKLTSAQAEANFDYFLASKSSRISALATLLSGFGIDVHAGMADPSPDTLITQLYQWSGEHWPQYFDKAIHNDSHWLASDKHGNNLMYSVISDTAIVIGDLIIKHRPTYGWGLDRLPGNKIMASYNRCVLLAPWLPEPGEYIAIDVEAEVAQRFLHADYFAHQYEEKWLQLVHGCISGDAEGAHLSS